MKIKFLLLSFLLITVNLFGQTKSDIANEIVNIGNQINRYKTQINQIARGSDKVKINAGLTLLKDAERNLKDTDRVLKKMKTFASNNGIDLYKSEFHKEFQKARSAINRITSVVDSFLYSSDPDGSHGRKMHGRMIEYRKNLLII